MTYPQTQLDLLIQELIAAPQMNFNADMRRYLPTTGGIYRICNSSANPQQELYIGIAGNLRRRLYANHFRGQAENSTLTRKLIRNHPFENAIEVHAFLAQNCAAQYLEIEDKRLRCFAEHYAIAILQPLYND